jgi:hypothetical protein
VSWGGEAPSQRHGVAQQAVDRIMRGCSCDGGEAAAAAAAGRRGGGSGGGRGDVAPGMTCSRWKTSPGRYRLAMAHWMATSESCRGAARSKSTQSVAPAPIRTRRRQARGARSPRCRLREPGCGAVLAAPRCGRRAAAGGEFQRGAPAARAPPRRPRPWPRPAPAARCRPRWWPPCQHETETSRIRCGWNPASRRDASEAPTTFSRVKRLGYDFRARNPDKSFFVLFSDENAFPHRVDLLYVCRLCDLGAS